MGDEIWTVMRGVRLAEQGSWPVAGGWLDQSEAFLAAVDFVRIERARK